MKWRFGKKHPLPSMTASSNATDENEGFGVTSSFNNYCTTIDFADPAVNESVGDITTSYEAFEEDNKDKTWTVLKVQKYTDIKGKRQRSIEVLRERRTYKEALKMLHEKETGALEIEYVAKNTAEELGLDHYRILAHQDGYVFDSNGNVHQTRNGRVVTSGNFQEDECEMVMRDFNNPIPPKMAEREASLTDIFGCASVLRNQDVLKNYATKMTYNDWENVLNGLIQDCDILKSNMVVIHRFLGERFPVEEGGIEPEKEYNDRPKRVIHHFPDEKEFKGYNKINYPHANFFIGKTEVKDLGHKTRIGFGSSNTSTQHGPGYIDIFVELAEDLHKKKPYVMGADILQKLKELRFFSSYIFAKAIYFTLWNDASFGKKVFDHSIEKLREHFHALPKESRPDWKNIENMLTTRSVDSVAPYVEAIKTHFEEKLKQTIKDRQQANTLMDSRQKPKGRETVKPN